MHYIEHNLNDTHKRIIDAARQFGRNPTNIKLIAISKKHSIDSINQAIRAGQNQFGENYLQAALEKINKINDSEIKWHFIGQIQSNKTRDIAENFAWVQSVDRLKIAQRLSQQRPTHLPPLNILLQVNISHEPQKAGIDLSDIEPLLDEVSGLANIRCRGLMAIGAKESDFTKQRAWFRPLKEKFDQLKQHRPALDTLSMGMSGDLEAAIAEGATMVRIGTDIFGHRQG